MNKQPAPKSHVQLSQVITIAFNRTGNKARPVKDYRQKSPAGTGEVASEEPFRRKSMTNLFSLNLTETAR